MNPIRDQIIDALDQDLPADQQADLVLKTVAEWLTTAELDFRLGMALSEAAPGKFDHGVHGDEELTSAARAVVAEAAKVIRPAPATVEAGERPAVADRYAVLAGGAR